MFPEALAQCVESFGASPRRISLWDRLTYWRLVRPDWLIKYPNDELETLFLNLAKLRRHGVVVWGHIIQANNLLFAPGDSDLPAEVVYSLDDSRPANPDELGAVASALFSLKHTKPAAPDQAAIADYLTNERVRVYGRPVPPAISPRLNCQTSTIYVIRKHLPAPSRCLQQSFMPIIVHPKPPHVTLVLPSRYWPRMLVDWWQGAEPDGVH